MCVFNVPLLLSPMTRGGPPRVLALSPGVLSLLYLSTGHGRSPKDNHTCMFKKGPFSSQHPQRKSDIPNCSPTAVVLFMVTFEFFFPALTLKRTSLTILNILIKQDFKSRFV